MKFATRYAGIVVTLAFTTLALPAAAQQSLYESQFGGKAGMEKIVHDTVNGVLADPRIKDFFEDADIPRLEALLAEQFCELTNGPCHYEGKSMKEAHEKFAIRNAHFNFLAEHLQVAMEAHGVPNWAQNKLIAKLAPMQREIVKP